MRPVVSAVLRSRIAMVGATLTTAGALLFLVLVALDFFGYLENPYAGIVVFSLLFAVAWLGGWSGPVEDWLGWLWTLLKGFVVAVVIIWLRVSWPRLREDQLQRLAWVWLVPIALLQLAITAVGVVMMR